MKRLPLEEQKVFALDYDGTYTVDPKLWLMFVKAAQARGHTIIVATMRYPHEYETMCVDLLDAVKAVAFTSRKAKLPYLKQLCINVDVWIDDNPHWLF